MKTRPTPAALATAFAVALALLTAAPASADAVRRQQLDAPVNVELASGLSTSLVGDNLKRTSDLTLDTWWSDDSAWNRYSYVLNNPIKLIDPDGKEVAVAVRPVQSAQWLGHTYLVVTPTGANKTSERFAEYLEGKNRFSLSGTNGSRMVEEYIQQNRLISKHNDKMDEMGDATQLFTVNPPDGLSMEEFEQRILDAFESYESGRIHYNNSDFNFSGRNSNAFTSGVLNGAGVNLETLPPIVGLGMYGWGDPIQLKATPGEEGDTEAWLERKKRENAAHRARQ